MAKIAQKQIIPADQYLKLVFPAFKKICTDESKNRVEAYRHLTLISELFGK